MNAAKQGPADHRRYSLNGFDPSNERQWIALRAFRSQFRWTDQSPYGDDDETFELRERQRFESDPTWCRFIVENDSVVVASSTRRIMRGQVGSSKGTILYFILAVAGSHRRRGIGGSLLAKTVEIPHIGVELLTQRSFTLDKDGLAFASRQGFRSTRSFVHSERRTSSADLEVELARRREQLLRAAPGLRLQVFGRDLDDKTIRQMLPLYSESFYRGNLGSAIRAPEPLDFAGFTAHLRRMRSSGAELYLSLLSDEQNKIVGLAAWKWSRSIPDAASGVIVGVDERWRGLGLSSVLRAAVVARIVADHSTVTRLLTQSWSNNKRMISPNSDFSFLPKLVSHVVERTAVIGD